MPFLDQGVPLLERVVHHMDFWSDVDDIITLDTTAGDETLPAVTVAEIPEDAVFLRVIAMFKYRAVENSNASDNALIALAAEHIQVDRTGGTFIDAIAMADNAIQVAGSTRDGGDVWIGAINIVSEVDRNDTYEFRMENADVDGNNLILRDVQTGLRVYFTLGS